MSFARTFARQTRTNLFKSFKSYSFENEIIEELATPGAAAHLVANGSYVESKDHLSSSTAHISVLGPLKYFLIPRKDYLSQLKRSAVGKTATESAGKALLIIATLFNYY